MYIVLILIVLLIFSILSVAYTVVFNKNKTPVELTKRDCIEDFLDIHIIYSN